jgi:hypothetical protein
MPILVSCRCGKRFAAKEHLLGRQVPCPACRQPLTVTESLQPADGIYVACACGRGFMAPDSMRGHMAQCRYCGRTIRVPEPDPLGLGSLLPDAPAAPLATLPPISGESEIPWGALTKIGLIGGGIFVLVIAVTMVMNFYRAQPQGRAVATVAADVPQVGSQRAPMAPLPPPPSASSVVTTTPSVPAPPPLPAETPTPGSLAAVQPSSDLVAATAPRASVQGAQPRAASGGVERLPQGASDWHGQSGVRLKGVRPVKPGDPPYTQFSWMTELLPFLGHQQLYQQFDFQKPLTEGKNLQLSSAIVPEFLNPLDDRQRWKGYPLHGMALTHFVGLSGVEDARNVVAAKLPRSDSRAGIFGYDEVARREEITDGTSQTIMIAGAGELANPWVFGGGATIRGAREPLFDKRSGLGTKGVAGGGSVVVMADGSVRHVSAEVDPRVFKAMTTIHGADSVDIEQSSAPFSFGSLKK